MLESAAAGSCTQVEIVRADGCARCARGQGCGAGIFNLGIAPVRLPCLTQRSVHAGETVTVEFDDGGSHWLWLVCGAYGLPTAGLLIATIGASVWIAGLSDGSAFLPVADGHRDLVLAAAGMTGLAGGLIAWRMIASEVLLLLEKRLCLQTGRIVSGGTVSLDPAVLSRSSCPTRENP